MKEYKIASIAGDGIGKEVVHEENPNILGMVNKVKHLVQVIKLWV